MNTRVRIWTAVVLSISTGAVWSAPVTFNTALPVHEGGWVLREQFVSSKNADDLDPANRNMKVSGLITVLGHGITRDVALFGVLPYFDKRLDLDQAGQRISRGDEGIGDLTLIGRYTAYVRDAPGRTFRVAPFLGVKAPTGRDDAQDRLGLLPPALQAGSGSWDVLAGVVATYQSLDFQLDSQLSYKANGEANGFRFGNVSEFDVSFQYRPVIRRESRLRATRCSCPTRATAASRCSMSVVTSSGSSEPPASSPDSSAGQ